MEEVNDWVEKIKDEDEFVRLNAAERIDINHLPQMMDDENEYLRLAI